MDITIELMHVCEIARFASDARTPRSQAVYFASVSLIKTMQPLTLPSGGVIGGEHAFRRTSDFTKSVDNTVRFYHNNAWERFTVCELHGRQKTAIAHIFPRSFGGVFNGIDTTNVVCQCSVCNHKHSDTIQQIDIDYLLKVIVKISI